MTASNGDLAWSRAGSTPHHGTPVTASIVVLGTDGRERVLAHAATYRTPPAWSPDGRTVAFVADGALVLVRGESAFERIVECEPPSCLGIGPPSWSPDGTAIAFGMLGSRAEALVVVETRDPRPEVVADVAVEGPPAWSPDGRSIAVLDGETLHVLNAHDGRLERSIPVDGARLGDRVSWSPDGATFAVEATIDGTQGIYLIALEGGAVTLLSSCPEEGCTDLDPAWSPDGTRIVFTRAWCDVAAGDCSTGDLYVIEVAGGDAQPLVDGAALDCCAAWQPLVAA